MVQPGGGKPAPPATAKARPWPAPFDSAPVLQSPAPDAMTVTVAVNAISTAWVEYGTTESLGSRADDSRHGLLPLSGRVHRIRLTGLAPRTRYFYRVMVCPIDFRSAYKISRSKPVAGGVRSFTTLDNGLGGAASFAVINDTHETPETLTGVTSLLSRRPSDLTFWNGDIFNDVRSDDQIVGQIMRPADSEYAAQTPLCFVSGNHDVRGIHARSLDRFVEVPDNRRYYMLRQGPVAFVVLDTGEDKPDDHGVYAGLNDFARYRQEQQRWLEEAIKADAWRSAAFRVAILHIPLWGKAASEDSRRKWAGALAEGNLDVVINGHVHEYKHTPPGISNPYAQLVGGGPKPESATVIRGEADEKRMALLVYDLVNKEIGNFEFKRT